MQKRESIFKDEGGMAFVEFAILSTILTLLFVGSIELSRCLLIMQKLEKVASTVADVTTQVDPNNTPLSTSQLSQLMSAVTDMMSPYSSGTSDPNILVVISDVTKSGTNNPVLNWQYCGGGTLTATSQVGSTIGSSATLPNSFSMNAGEEVVIGEAFYKFTPIITNNKVLGSFQMYKTATFMPRLGALSAFASSCR